MSQEKREVVSAVSEYGILVIDVSDSKMPSEKRKEQAKQTLYLNRV